MRSDHNLEDSVNESLSYARHTHAHTHLTLSFFPKKRARNTLDKETNSTFLCALFLFLYFIYIELLEKRRQKDLDVQNYCILKLYSTFGRHLLKPQGFLKNVYVRNKRFK